MAEYESFHYLMHKTPDAIAANFVTGPKPLTFNELYSPRDDIRKMGFEEKHYWRTRDRLRFTFYEIRQQKCMIVTVFNLELNEFYRTLVIDLELLYNEVDAKNSTESRKPSDPIVKKATKVFQEDAKMDSACIKYMSARLNIQKDPIIWPGYEEKVPPPPAPVSGPSSGTAPVSLTPDVTPPSDSTVITDATTDATAVAVGGTETGVVTTTDAATVVASEPTSSAITGEGGGGGGDSNSLSMYHERMSVVDKLTVDEFEKLEIELTEKIEKIILSGNIEHLKLVPTDKLKADAAASAGVDVSSASTGADTTTAPSPSASSETDAAAVVVVTPTKVPAATAAAAGSGAKAVAALKSSPTKLGPEKDAAAKKTKPVKGKNK